MTFTAMGFIVIIVNFCPRLFVPDNDLIYEQNLAAVAKIAPVAQNQISRSPSTGKTTAKTLRSWLRNLFELGVVGANIEDLNNCTGKLRLKAESVQRIKTALEPAKAAGVPDFVVYTRTDVIAEHGTVGDGIYRAIAYLEAGATTAFTWGGRHGLRGAEVQKMVGSLGGMLSVVLPGSSEYLSVEDVATLGVARVSIGPKLQFDASGAIRKSVKDLLLLVVLG